MQWAMYLTLVVGMTGEGTDQSTAFSISTFVGFLLQPGSMWEMLHLLSKEGLWSVLSIQPAGTFLWIIWLLEALIIVAIALTYGADKVRHPYSETARAWATEAKLPQLLTPQPSLEDTRTALETSHFEQVLHPATYADATPGEFWQLRLHRVPGDESCHYLSLDKVTRKLDKKDKLETDTDPLIQHLAISPARYAALTARFGPGQPQEVLGAGEHG